MSSRPAGRRLAAVALVVGLVTGCGPAASSEPPVPAILASPPVEPQVSPPWRPTPTLAAPTLPPGSPSATVTVPVQISALGNVYIRRGPDLAFNPVAVLPKGQVVMANARDVLADWLRVPVPGDDSQQGWISIMSEFTRVTGSVDGLQEIDPQVWPDLAWLRNCTLHELWIEPAGVALPPVYEFPNNELRLNPGIYSVMDSDVEGYPEILKAELREGLTTEVLIDGLGEKKKCPPP